MPAPPARRIAGVLFLLMLALVVWGSLMRMPATGGGQIDKVQHFAAYATLTALAFAAAGRRSWLLATAVAALGAGVEALQTVLPTGRTGSFWDMAANIAGAVTVWLVWTAVVRLRRPLPPDANPGPDIHP